MGAAKRHKIALYSPYLDILGGGERFILTIAEYLSLHNDVFIYWNSDSFINLALKKLGIDLSRVKIIKKPLTSLDFAKKNLFLDHFFYMTDGSLFFSSSKKNYLIIQSPAHIPKDSINNRLKLMSYNRIICYSKFVGQYIKKYIKRQSLIIPPPVLTDLFKEKDKKNIILSVGRFFPWLHNKKQEVLITAFKKLVDNHNLIGWQLVLIGSVDKGGEAYFNKIKKQSQGYPISILTQINAKQLAKYYGKAKIYWHAAGYGEDLKKYPQRAEHFGISTVESMASSCVPIVFNGGGQKEIIVDGQNGFLWKSIADLLHKTLAIINDESLRKKIIHQAKNDSFKYSKDEFIKKINQVITS